MRDVSKQESGCAKVSDGCVEVDAAVEVGGSKVVEGSVCVCEELEECMFVDGESLRCEVMCVRCGSMSVSLAAGFWMI